MNKNHIVNLLIAICCVIGGMACVHQAKDISIHQSCMQCGMDRGTYDFSRMWIDYEDGTSVAICSVHCAAVDMEQNIDKVPISIKVADLKSGHLIDAKKAFWVVGGKKRGVMSREGKWAFKNKDDAENFMKTNLGRLVSFNEALERSYLEMPFDTKAIRKKMNLMNLEN